MMETNLTAVPDYPEECLELGEPIVKVPIEPGDDSRSLAVQPLILK